MSEERPLLFRGVRIPGYNLGTAWASETAQQWRNGVLAALDSLGLGEGDPSPEVQAFMAVIQDDPDTAVRLVADMSGRDRAVLSFWLHELSEIVDAAETARRVDDNERTRGVVRAVRPDS